MSKDRATIGTDGLPLPLLPPERDPRVWARLVRIMFYLPGFMALLLIKSGEAASFGITVELLMLSSAAAIIGGLYVGSESSGPGADSTSKTGVWSGALILEMLAVVPFLCALPSLFHELSHSTLLHSKETADAVATAASGSGWATSQMLPMVAILPFMLYQLAGYGTLHFVVPKVVNWLLNIVIFALIVASYIANREGEYPWERGLARALVTLVVIIVFYGVLKLKGMQADYDARAPKKEKEPK
jgi:hypothetical protein